MKLSVISLALIPMLSLSAAQAAVYQVIEVGDVPEVRSTVAAALNDTGEIVFNGGISREDLGNKGLIEPNFTGYYKGDATGYYNFPLNLSVIDFTVAVVKNSLTDEQLADAQNGITDAASLSVLLSLNIAAQAKGLALPYFKATNADAENIILRDFTPNPRRGNSEYLYDINNQSVAVGIASNPFERISFTPAATEQVPEPEAIDIWMPQGPVVSGVIVKNGVVTTIPAPFQDFGGGYSLANAISNTGYIAGVASTGIAAAAKEQMLQRCDGKAQPVALCQFNAIAASPLFIDVLNPFVTNPGITSTGYYDRAGMIWRLVGDTISEPEVLGFLGDKNTGEPFVNQDAEAVVNNINYISRPLDVNDKGLAVGWSVYSDSSRHIGDTDIIERSYHASLFVDGKATPLVDPIDWERSAAVAINNNDVVVGGAIRVINSSPRTKMFIHDYHLGKTNFVDGFFVSSTTIPKDINDDNIIVGKAEAILANTTSRRDRAFIMDVTKNSFLDLNSLVDCSSAYTLIDATSINNHGEILATALVEKEFRDVKGNIVLDDAGMPIKTNVTTTVKLIPIANGEPEDCGNTDHSYSRKAGSFSFAWLLGLVLVGWRRFQA